ncbi:MAG: hypothetical protein M3Y07_12215 [Acidobacteriota bacterium]|nr:hypothetical protein [Acidobacteriota bacterium]
MDGRKVDDVAGFPTVGGGGRAVLNPLKPHLVAKTFEFGIPLAALNLFP